MQDKIRDLTQGDLSSHLYRIALPIMGTSFVQIAYNITDMIWLGRLSSQALAAVGAASVFLWIAASFALINKIGSEVTISQGIGAGRRDEAKSYASQNVCMSLLLSVGMLAIYLLFAGNFLDLYALIPSVRAEGLSYLYLSLVGFPSIYLTASFTGIYNAIGDSRTPFRISILGLATNMLLDPLFIFTLGWGVSGAALATVVSQGLVLLLFLYQVKRDKLFGGLPLPRPTALATDTTHPTDRCTACFAAGTLCLRQYLYRPSGIHSRWAYWRGDDDAGAQIESLTWNTASGVTEALTTIVGQNFAAGKLRRVYTAFCRALSFTLIIGVLGDDPLCLLG